MNRFTIALKQEKGKHLYEQLYEYIRDEIREGRLLYHEKLPSTRSLAEYLQVSRSTVEVAYEQLLSEGYIEAEPYRGYYVSKIEELYHLEMPTDAVKAPDTDRKEDYLVDFSPTKIEMEEFPFDTWRRLTKNILSGDRRELFSLGESQGDRELRVTISRYLHASRGVNCTPEQIIVGAGNDYLLMLLQKILGQGRKIAIENPTYKRAYRMFHSFGYEVHTVSMDAYGMDVGKLRESQAELAYVMPSHQYPMGVVMPIGRRTELLNWAAEAEERYLIEDDYDSEFRYRGKPVPSLQASDHLGKVIYMGTFSKSIAPAIRVSYMVLPDRLLKKYQKECTFLASTVSRIDQAVLNDFIAGGHYERYLNKMRKIYKGKHDLLLSELKGFEKKFSITGENAGLHLILTCKSGETEEELIESARKRRVRVYGLGESLVAQTDSHTETVILLGYAGAAKEKIAEGIGILREAWGIRTV